MKLGCAVRDKVTGVTGVVTAMAQYLYGSDRICYRPDGKDADGKPFEEVWVDASQVELV